MGGAQSVVVHRGAVRRPLRGELPGRHEPAPAPHHRPRRVRVRGLGQRDRAALWGDPGTGSLYVVISDQVWQWDADPGLRMVYDWLSREWVFATPMNLGAAKVDADFS
jgi:hypothetical protein